LRALYADAGVGLLQVALRERPLRIAAASWAARPAGRSCLLGSERFADMSHQLAGLVRCPRGARLAARDAAGRRRGRSRSATWSKPTSATA